MVCKQVKIKKNYEYNFMSYILKRNNMGLGSSIAKTINNNSIFINSYGVLKIINRYMNILIYIKKYIIGDLIFIRNKEIYLIKEVKPIRNEYIKCKLNVDIDKIIKN